MEVGAELLDGFAVAGIGGDRRWQRGQGGGGAVPGQRLLHLQVARRPDVTLEELRAWLLENHQVAASLGLMHKTLVRLGLTLKKSRAGRKSRIGPMSPSNAPTGAPSRAR